MESESGNTSAKTSNPMDEALAKAISALELAEKQSGSGSQDTIVCLNILGALLNDMGQYPEALGYYIRARESIENYLGPNHPLMSEVISGIGENYLRQSMIAEAQMYFEKALSVRDAIGRGHDAHSAELLVKIGELYCLQSEFDKAKENLVRAYEILSVTKSGHEHVMGDLNHNLGVIALSSGSFEEAKKYLENACRIREKTHGTSSAEYAQSMWALGSAQENLGDIIDSRKSYLTAYESRRDLMGDDDPVALSWKEKLDTMDDGPSKAVSQAAHTAPSLNGSSSPVHDAGGHDTEAFVHLLSAAILLLEAGHIEMARSILSHCLAFHGITDLHERVDLDAIVRGLVARYPEIQTKGRK